MEEQRISRMYVNLVKQQLRNAWYGLTGQNGRGSSLFPVLAILVVLLVPGGIWMAHRHAQFHSLEQKISGENQEPTGPRPGGRDPIVLRRTASSATEPQFASMTLLPGLGMDVLQITAFLPGRGEVPLLVAPTVQQIADGTDQPVLNDLHGALELPWSGSMEGLPTPLGTTQTESWNGQTVTTPTDVGGVAGIVRGGLLRLRDADDAAMTSLPDGAAGTANFSSTDFDEHWFSRTQALVQVAMRSSVIELTIEAKNVGDKPEPMGIGWHPRFAVLGGRRGEITLRLPQGQRLEYADKVRHTPSGKLLAPGGSLEAFVNRPGALGVTGLDEGLAVRGGDKAGSMPFAELRDAQGGYGVRVTAVSDSLHELRVEAPADQTFVGLGLQTNFDDPLARVWTGNEAIATLQPGETLEWKVRLEIFPVVGGNSGR